MWLIVWLKDWKKYQIFITRIVILFLTCSLRRPLKPAILFSTADRQTFFESFAGSRVNTPHVAVTFVGWRVYTQVFLNEWVHSFVDFCLIPYPRPIPLTFQPQICKDGFISIVFYVSPECCLFDRVLADNQCFGACNGTSCAEERRSQ